MLLVLQVGLLYLQNNNFTGPLPELRQANVTCLLLHQH